MSQTLLIKDIRIFDGENEIPSGSVLVENGLVKQVSRGSLNAPDASTVVISKPGHTLIPGIIDGHIHAHIDEQNTVLGQALKFGVTTVCDMHQEVENLAELRSRALNDPNSADFKTASQSATVSGGWPTAIITAHDKSEETLARVATWPDLKNRADVEAFIRDRVEDKADYIKLMHEDGNGLSVKPNLPSLELQKDIIDVAHQNGLLTVAHATSLQGTLQILRLGIDGLTHTFCDQPPTQEVIDAYLANNAHCNPTLVAIASLTTEGQREQERYSNDPRASKFLNSQGKQNLCKCMALANDESKVEYAYQTVRKLKAAGIDIIMGSDSAGPALGTAFGLSAHQELATLVAKCDFTPKEALIAGTSLVAKRLRLKDRGRIAEGLRADLVLIEGNPLEDIDRTLDIRGVWKQGTLCSTYSGLAA
ncbi:uncharacterized protein GGS22DRAFT_120314 [Annulohypoxylon maeteangense]|uniref:uncharacterized protein n=1 Tax=Annulohypoxylon maeteangense TaxID=1927788 RepID=UPI0020078214|nr:uncharacterized protein GGS22DRAFT_120314 [Annulohypoxylon maeteangense]KAI0887000.1 hypothetical protein GGS22DRAFT_120314 [Annulohypoxylon maeteangense]